MPLLTRYLARLLALLLIALTPAQALAEDEPAVRAAMILNLLRFIAWPGTLPPQMPLRVCLIETSPALSEAMKVLDKRVVATRPLYLYANQQLNNLSACDIAVTDSVGSYDPAKLWRYGLLTIGDKGFVDQGGMIGIVKIEDRVRFEINHTEMQRAGFNLPAQVLQLAIRQR